MTSTLRPPGAVGPALSRARHHDASSSALAATIVVVGVVLGYQAAARLSTRWLWPLLLGALLMALGTLLCHVVARGDRPLRALLAVTLMLKLAFSAVRLFVNETVYEGQVDAGGYHDAGVRFGENLAQGRWSIDGSEIASFPLGTRTIGYVTGVVYHVIGPSYEGGYVVFGFMAWLGLLAFFLAYRTARPDGSHRLAAAAIMLLPSVLYWPSSIGKDAFLVLLLGGCVLGVAYLVTDRHRVAGLVLLGGAGWLVAQVRPHVVLVALFGLAAAAAAAPAGDRSGARRRLLLLAVLLPLLVVGSTRMEEMFGDDRGSYGLEATLDGTVTRTSRGGSAFDGTPVRNPLQLPRAAVDVLFRPFPQEAASGPELLAALESMVLAVGAALSLTWLWRVAPVAFRDPFVAFCAAYTVMFVVAFSNVANAGILARQRVQLLPVLAMLVVVAHEEHRRSWARACTAATGVPIAEPEEEVVPELVVTAPRSGALS